VFGPIGKKLKKITPFPELLPSSFFLLSLRVGWVISCSFSSSFQLIIVILCQRCSLQRDLLFEERERKERKKRSFVGDVDH